MRSAQAVDQEQRQSCSAGRLPAVEYPLAVDLGEGHCELVFWYLDGRTDTQGFGHRGKGGQSVSAVRRHAQGEHAAVYRTSRENPTTPKKKKKKSVSTSRFWTRQVGKLDAEVLLYQVQ